MPGGVRDNVSARIDRQ